MRILAGASLLLALAGCPDPLGRPCDQDDDCGPGFDCFPDVCVRVCTKDDECAQSETCYRYHCVTPGQEHQRSRRPSTAESPTPHPVATTSRPTPPIPNVTAAELRAIRRELELMRHEQSRLAEAVEKLQGKTKEPARAGPVKLEKQ